jgi:ABC-type phosphate transport system substrate-binding protein
MKNLQSFLAAGALCMCAAINAHAGDIKIIANSSVQVSDVSADDLKRVFLATKTSFSDSGRLEPIVQKGGAAHEEFLKKYLGKTDSGLDTYYRSLVFTGKGTMPKTLNSDSEVAAYVARTKGAIGYVSAGTAAPGAKIIEVK